MILHIIKSGDTKIKNDQYDFSLNGYPHFQAWEWNYVIAFLSYEKAHGRTTEVMSEDKRVVNLVNMAMEELDGTEYIPPLKESIEKYVYHATDVTSAAQILSSGVLLSATKVYGKTGEEIVWEKRKWDSKWIDSADFYEYIMFGWGDHLVGDYVVLSTNWPCDEDFAAGNFDAGIRFYFLYERLLQHPGHTFDGYHVIKVKEEIKLADYLYACIVPEQYKEQLEKHVLPELSDKIYYLSQRGMPLEDWNQKVIEFVDRI